MNAREQQVRAELRRMECIEAGTHTWDNAGAGIDGGDRCTKCGMKVDRPEESWECGAQGHLYEHGNPKCIMCGLPHAGAAPRLPPTPEERRTVVGRLLRGMP